MAFDGGLSSRTRTEGEAMKQLVAAFALAFALVVPRTAPAGENWDAVKEEWGYRPWAVLLAAPAFLATAPFMLVKGLMEGSDDDDEEESASDDDED
jgi:hypothetical protein